MMTSDANTRWLGKELWRMSYPTMISFALQSIYDIVDMAWVGRISKEAISGVTLFITVYMLFTVLNEVAGASSVSMLSQSYGRGDAERTQKIAEQTISFKIVLAILSGLLLLVFLKPMLSVYTDDEIVIRAALDYGYIRIYFLPMMFSSYSVNTIFRCSGDAKTPMTIMIISAVLNLILDPIFIFDTVPYIGMAGLGLGVFGAALATVIATTISFLYGFLILLSGRRAIRISFRGLLKLDRTIDLSLLTIGLPSGLQLLIRQSFNAVLIKFVTIYGTTAIAVAGIGGKLINFAFMPIFGFMMAGSALVGHALGRERPQDAVALSQIATRINVSIISAAALLASIFPRQVSSLFSKDAAVIDACSVMIRVVAVAMVIMAYTFSKKIVFSGAGHNKPQLYASVFSRWMIQLPAMAVVVLWLKLPIIYLWFTYILAEIAELAVVMYHYRKGEWMRKRV